MKYIGERKEESRKGAKYIIQCTGGEKGKERRRERERKRQRKREREHGTCTYNVFI